MIERLLVICEEAEGGERTKEGGRLREGSVGEGIT
jgi:hypothetical protein